MMSKRLREALKKAHHELTTLHGLSATDGFKAYNDALRAGCDQNGAWDVFVEETWSIDVLDTLKTIEAALATDVLKEPEDGT
jgi:hypothetical protein